MTSSAPKLRAVIFDVDGTVAETERDGHRLAFNRAFRDHGFPYQWEVGEYGALLHTTGGRQRLARYLTEHGHQDGEARRLAEILHQTKTGHFLTWIRGGNVQARPGVHQLMRELRGRGVAVGVATTGSRAWVLPLLGRLFGDVDFGVVVTGDDVTQLKPHPEAYLFACARLGLPPADAVAIEDSPPGLAAAIAAGLRCLVVTSAYTRSEDFPGASAVVPGYLATDPCGAVVPPYLRSGVTAVALARLHSAAPPGC